jgi:hypothetical protein
MDDHTKDSKKSPIYQFQLFVIRLNLLKITRKKFNPQNSTISLAITIFFCTYTQAYSTPLVY